MRTTPARRRRTGATLIELLVALLLLDLSLVSLASLSAVAARRIGDAGRRHRAAVAAMNRLERLAAQPCALASGGAGALEPNVFESWSVRPLPLSMEVTDSVELRIRGNERLVVRTRMRC